MSSRPNSRLKRSATIGHPGFRLLLDGEQVFVAYKGRRDYVVFTSRRIIAVNVQGITGKKRTSPPCPTPGFRPSPWRPPARSTSMPSSSCGSPGWATDVAYLNRLVAGHVL